MKILWKYRGLDWVAISWMQKKKKEIECISRGKNLESCSNNISPLLLSLILIHVTYTCTKHSTYICYPLTCYTLEYSCSISHIELNISVTVKCTQSSLTQIYMYIIFYHDLIIKVLQTSPHNFFFIDTYSNQ